MVCGEGKVLYIGEGYVWVCSIIMECWDSMIIGLDEEGLEENKNVRSRYPTVCEDIPIVDFSHVPSLLQAFMHLCSLGKDL